MKSILRNLGSKYFWGSIYFLNVLFYKLFLDRKKSVVVVLTPGKVGSSSVYQSLKSEMSNCYIFHIHFLSKSNISNGISLHKKSVRNSVPYHFITSKIFNSFFIRSENRIKFVILFREPLDRYISDVYQNSNRLVDKIDVDNNLKIIADIKVDLVAMEHMKYVEQWVEDELHINLGYDFFKKSQLATKRYYIDNNEKYDFLFIKMEVLNSDFSLACKEFFGKEITMEKANISNDKQYHSLYKQAKKEVSLSPMIIDEMKSYKYSTMIYPIKS